MTTAEPKLITPDDHADFIGIVRGPNLASVFLRANEMLDEPTPNGVLRRVVLWVPDQTGERSPQPTVKDGERPAFPAPTDPRIQARGTYIVAHQPLPDSTVQNDTIPHIDGVCKKDRVWYSDPPQSRLCVQTLWGKRKNMGTVLYEAVPTTDLMDDQGNIRPDKKDQLGQAWQATTGSAIFMRMGGHSSRMAFHRADILQANDGPGTARIINRITYDWVLS